MGRFVNPDNSAFQVALNSEIYVDKTGLLAYTNQVMHTDRAWICSSRPRRFGKSITANMLAAYYSRGCDSKQMFAGLSIAREESFAKHLNQYDVIHFDVQWCCMDAGGPEHVTAYINQQILQELREAYPEAVPAAEKTAYGAMSCIYAAAGKKFVVIVDEWDVLIRDAAANQAAQETYINFLRGMFKGTEPTRFIALAYLTGILPIKKVKTQSALNNFDEFTMLDASVMAPFVGFTEDEVRALCGTYEAIRPLLDMDFDGLKAAVLAMLSGDSAGVRVRSFQNDVVSLRSRDDVLTLLIHLGYLAYDEGTQTAFIPNEEIRSEFAEAVEENRWNEWMEFQRESAALLEATLDMDGEAVAEGIEKIHGEYASAIRYNDENSLSSVLAIGYLSAMQYYFKPIREMPAGRGFADFVFIPKPEYAGSFPALLAELKWNKSAQTAIEQIKEQRYPAALAEFSGEILLVGISYDRRTKEHQCRIEKYTAGQPLPFR